MYMDFHTHGKLAKRLPFSTVYTDWLFGEAKGAGLDALCLTEHFNTLGFDQVYGYLLDKYHRDGDHPAYRPGTADLRWNGDRYCRGRPYPLYGCAGGNSGIK